MSKKTNFTYNYNNAKSKTKGILDITTRCNDRCLFCSNIHNPGRIKGPDWDMRKFYLAFSHLDEAEEIQFCGAGGESLLNKDFPQMLSHCKTHGKETAFYTNGYALSPNSRTDHIALNTDRIFISFVSSRPHIQEKFMKGIKLGQIELNLKELSHSYPQIELSMNVLVMKENIYHLDEILSFATDSGVSQLTLTLMQQF